MDVPNNTNEQIITAVCPMCDNITLLFPYTASSIEEHADLMVAHIAAGHNIIHAEINASVVMGRAFVCKCPASYQVPGYEERQLEWRVGMTDWSENMDMYIEEYEVSEFFGQQAKRGPA